MNNQYNYQADDRIRQQQAKVQEVVGIMKDNVNLVLERETRLAEIDTRAGTVIYPFYVFCVSNLLPYS
uniref:V-SNARE coiled-coil homology domain-containing protein n=1 Tax=Schistosoma haematobium TaxID=6185 RepID=A0A095B2D1_SCHHA